MGANRTQRIHNMIVTLETIQTRARMPSLRVSVGGARGSLVSTAASAGPAQLMPATSGSAGSRRQGRQGGGDLGLPGRIPNGR